MGLRRWNLEGRHVLITGAAQGIGRDAAARLAKRGARLSLLDLNPEGVERAAT
ncbi:MAG: SDR family NAD(P)-dependent oxidoreductase, partial [Solirubrobacterales bacterium]